MPRRPGLPDATKAPADRLPPRRRGGQELPDDVQDRPEQNAGYDEAVHEGPAGTPQDPLIEVDLERALEIEGSEDEVPDSVRTRKDVAADIDERAARAAAAEVRRRERTQR